MPKKATSILKSKGRGYIKLWTSKRNNSILYRDLWTDLSSIFFDTGEFSDLPSGCYEYKNGNIIPIKHKDMPDIKGVIPSQKGYKIAELQIATDGNQKYIQVFVALYSNDHLSKLIKLRAKTKRNLECYIRYEYFEYLKSKVVDLSWCQFKIKDPQEPVLVFYERELKALIMPVKIKIEGLDKKNKKNIINIGAKNG